MMSDEFSILIVGTGAVGGYYGGKLSQGGASVSVACRSDYNTVAKHGIQIHSVEGDFIFKPESVVSDPSKFGKKAGFIIVATKVLPEINVPDLIRPAVMPDTAIVLLQNGIHIEKPVLEAFPGNEIISALAFICVRRSSPGVIHHEDFGKITIGRYPSGYSHKTAVLDSFFKKAGVDCTVTDDIETARWKKLIWNAPFNPLSVLAGGMDTSELMDSDVLVELAKKVMHEVRALAVISGHPLDSKIIKQTLESTKSMKPFKTSMLQDYESARPMEVEAILGNALNIAQKNKIETPYMETLNALLTALNKKRKSIKNPH